MVLSARLICGHRKGKIESTIPIRTYSERCAPEKSDPAGHRGIKPTLTVLGMEALITEDDTFDS
jgi:hypothetical protein